MSSQAALVNEYVFSTAMTCSTINMFLNQVFISVVCKVLVSLGIRDSESFLGNWMLEAKQKALQGEISLTLQAGTRQQQSKTTEMTFRQKKTGGNFRHGGPRSILLVSNTRPGSKMSPA